MKVVQIPGKLFVDNYEFELRLISPGDQANAQLDKANRLLFEQDEGLMLSGPAVYAIWLSASLTPRRRLEIVFHEITHAINWAHGIEDAREYVHVSEEQLADKHGKAWSQFWLDNPRFLLWLQYTLSRIRLDQRTEPKDKDVDTKTE